MTKDKIAELQKEAAELLFQGKELMVRAHKLNLQAGRDEIVQVTTAKNLHSDGEFCGGYCMTVQQRESGKVHVISPKSGKEMK